MAILDLQTVLKNLSRVEVHGDGYKAECPLCGKPTLSIRPGSAPPALIVRCYAPECVSVPVRAIFNAIEGRSLGFAKPPAADKDGQR